MKISTSTTCLAAAAALCCSTLPSSLGAESLPERGAAMNAPAKRWEEAFVSGNGRMGAMLFGNPENETFVANHCRLFLPLGSREIPADLAGDLPEFRKLIREQGTKEAMKFLNEKAAAQGFPGLTPTDPLHPGFFVHVRQKPAGEIRDYVMTEDFRTGEVVARWSDDRGEFRRRMFVSRTDHLIVLSLTGPAGGKLDCGLEFPAPAPPNRKITDAGWRPDVSTDMIVSDRKVTTGLVTYHNTYAMGKGGYDAAVRIVTSGGKTEMVNDTVKVSGADEVLMLMRIAPWKTPLPRERSEAWAYSPEHPDFKLRVGEFRPVPPLADSSVVPYAKDADSVALMPQLVKSVKDVTGGYDDLFTPHAKAHAELFERVSLDLGGGKDRARTSADLLTETRKTGALSPALMEKIYDAGRYMYICSAGELPPNLQGIWTGSWKPAWSGDFTLDTNVQLAMKHAFTGNLGELMEGYYRMIEGFYPEWELNARRHLGCDGYLTNARASNTALLLHWGKWHGGATWTAGCGWLAHFFFDQWQFTGDERFLRERTVPYLKEVVAFYEDFMLVDAKSGRYEFIPSYSPESSNGITSTMDVMVCKDALRSLITACRVLESDTDSIPKWEAMVNKLPNYRINSDGGLAEWVPEGGGEYYKHRHLSHLHSCYEALEDPALDEDTRMWAAAQEATRRRIHAGGEVSSHGRVHTGLAAAHLGMGEEAFSRIQVMATGGSMYSSLMCSHEPNGRIFNLDANGAMPEIMNRMLVRSHPGILDLLPALPKALPKGEIRGIRARQQILIESLAWDVGAKRLTLTLTSDKDQTVFLGLPGMMDAAKIKVTDGEARLAGITGDFMARVLRLKNGSRTTLEISW